MLKGDVLCSFIQTRAVKGTAFLSLYVYKLLWKTWNLEVCFRTCVGTDQAKFEKNLISRQIWLGFKHSLVSAVLCEANKSNWQRNERPFGSHSSKYWSACSVVHAQSSTVCGGGKRALVRAQMHILGDVMSRITAHNRLHHSSLENVTCARGRDTAKLDITSRQNLWYIVGF